MRISAFRLQTTVNKRLELHALMAGPSLCRLPLDHHEYWCFLTAATCFFLHYSIWSIELVSWDVSQTQCQYLHLEYLPTETWVSFLCAASLPPFWQKQNLQLVCAFMSVTLTAATTSPRIQTTLRICTCLCTCRCVDASLLCSLDTWILYTLHSSCNLSVCFLEVVPTHLVRSPLLLGFHFSQKAASNHLHPRVPPASLRTAPAIWALPGLIYGVWRPRLFWTVRAAAVVCGLWAAGSISVVKETGDHYKRAESDYFIFQRKKSLLGLCLRCWAF